MQESHQQVHRDIVSANSEKKSRALLHRSDFLTFAVNHCQDCRKEGPSSCSTVHSMSNKLDKKNQIQSDCACTPEKLDIVFEGPFKKRRISSITYKFRTSKPCKTGVWRPRCHNPHCHNKFRCQPRFGQRYQTRVRLHRGPAQFRHRST